MDYIKISKETIGYLYKAHKSLRTSGLDESLIALAELRVSQLNGCAYCCAFHSEELRRFGITQQAIDKLPGWQLTSAFNEKQKLVLQWVEVLTKTEQGLDKYKAGLALHFSEKEIVDITTSISLMNALNRLRIALGEED